MFVRFSAEQERHLRRWIEDCGLSTFAPMVRADLAKLLGSSDAVALVEAACAIGNFADDQDHKDMRRAVLKLLRKDRVSLGRGKKPNPAMTALVESVVPIAVTFGIPLRCGENAKMTRLLSVIAHSGLGMKGDPRDELRRQVRWERASKANTRRAILGAIARGLRPLSRDEPSG